MKKYFFTLLLPMLLLMFVLSNTAVAGFSEEAKIDSLYIYTSYAKILSGSASPGPANCVDDNQLSFNWSDFTSEERSRILATLLTAKAQQVKVLFSISDVVGDCGPEGKKKFNGNIIVR